MSGEAGDSQLQPRGLAGLAEPGAQAVESEWERERQRFNFALLPGRHSHDPRDGTRGTLLAWVIQMCFAASLAMLVPPPVGVVASAAVMLMAAWMTLKMQKKVRRYRTLEREYQRRLGA